MRPIAPRQVFEGAFTLDDAQAAAADLLSTFTDKGVYLWGPVGRGKTWLLDRYFEAAPTDAKKRVHFHSFFRDLHSSYFRHRFSIDSAVRELTDGVELLCFDEFHVHDIGDGRLLARMLDALFARGITLVLTSNYSPDGLMPNPLFHDSFVPTIATLKNRLDVVQVSGPVDYRTAGAGGSRFSSGIWTTEPSGSGVTFEEMCCAPKSAGDYLTILERTTTFTLTRIPALIDCGAFAVQRFCNLVDVLYDLDVRVAFHSLLPLNTFAQDCTGLDIERMVSRLSELRPESCLTEHSVDLLDAGTK